MRMHNLQKVSLPIRKPSILEGLCAGALKVPSSMALCTSPPQAATAPARNSLNTANVSRKAWSRQVGAVFSARRSAPILRVRASTDAIDEPERDTLVAEFMRYVNASNQSWPNEGRKPTALMPPNTVVKVQMDALMRNDWPEEDSGVRTAFQFSMPEKVEEMLAGQVPESVSVARAWDAAERYLTFSQFAALLREPLYAPIINCSDWKATSPVAFHGPGDIRALQCVKVTYQLPEAKEATRTYTFCLQKVKQGAYRNCWMVVGVRLGDYANV
ncbi:hypothetical protein GOP47_0009710 [Adiantum capillus-veneris]|uniref:Uncharacterized protein n=1 Tax=Adiantum capillus-veneris TaxID=13818 RepID=A0A9D4UX43_ADICA|nr:hypothetical protein GOP47_0009710 [Adiantum capillus-veneris]